MDDLIRRVDVIEALNECDAVRGYAYKQMHDAIMDIPSASESEDINEHVD